MSTATAAFAIFVTASLISLVVLSAYFGQVSMLAPAPHRTWTGPVPSGRFVDFVLDGRQKGFRVEISRLKGDGLTIGRDPRSCDLVIHDWYISARHARIWLDSNGLHVEDMKSTNGSWQSNRRIERATFRFGEPIRLGRTSFKLMAVEG